MWWLAAPTTTTTTTIVTSLLLRRLFNKSVISSKSCRALTSFFTTTTTTSSPASSSKFGDTNFILQTTEYCKGKYCKGKYKDDIKLYMLSSSESGSSDGDHGEDGNEVDDDDDDQKKKKKKKMVFKLDEDLGFSAIYKDYMLQDSLRMVGSCNGIICLHDPELKWPQLLRNVYLWNPATRHFRILPKSIPIEEGKHGVGSRQVYGSFVQDFVAFGFDVKNNDYKVLRITSFIQEDLGGVEGCMCQVQVYSLSTDSWRLLELEGINYLPAIPSQNRLNNHGIYLNGNYFFVGRKRKYGESDSMMLSFDFTKEIFTSMQLPNIIDNSHNNTIVLSCMGDKMAVFTRPPRIDDNDGTGHEYYDIWVLNEVQHGSGGGSESSWTKLHSFQIKIKNKRLDCQPRCISNNGEFALISTNTDGYRENLQLFNLVTKEAEKDFFLIDTFMCRAYVYKESLVSIMGGGGGNVLLRWQLPSHGTTYKLNLDAPFIKDYHRFGIGLCLTSDTGGCIGVRSLKAYDVRDATQGEALAMLEAIKWAIKLELSPIIIESDSKNVVSFFMDDDDDDDDNNSTYWSSEALSLLRESKLLLNSSEPCIISFQYCSRSRNYVADIAAKLGREGFWRCKEWTANSPGEIVISLSKDLGLITEKHWASDSGLETEEDSISDSGLETEEDSISDSGIELDKDSISDSGLETDKGCASK